MNNRYIKMKIILAILVFIFTSFLSAQQNDSTNMSSDEAAVKTTVEHFLTAAGNYDIETMPDMFTTKANIGGASLKNGKWNTFTMTLEEFLAKLKSISNPIKYKEPVHHYTVHIEEGKLAFVKADATLFREGKAQSNNFDYFTLLKENETWKILNGSYVSIPIDK